VKSGTYQVPLIGLDPKQKQALRAEQQRRAQSWVSPGRPVGTPAGTWVTDIAELGQCVLLCSACDHKFKPCLPRYGYHRDRTWKRLYGGVGGSCDGCREPYPAGLQLYVHEQFIGQGYATPR